MKYLSALAFAGMVLFAGCTKSPEWSPPNSLPPIGAKALFGSMSVVTNAVNAADIQSGKSPEPYLCKVARSTPITSVYNDKERGAVHVMLEEDSKAHDEFDDRTNSPYAFCKKGAIIEMTGAEFSSAMRYFTAKNAEKARQRAVQKEIEQVLRQKQ